MDKIKIATAFVIFCVLSLILFFLKFGAWSAFFGGAIALAYIYFVDKGVWEGSEIGFRIVYQNIKEEDHDLWGSPYYSELELIKHKETRPFGVPLGSYWYLTYEDDEGEMKGMIITGKSEILSHHETKGMSMKQAIREFMERDRRPMIYPPYNQTNGTRKMSDTDKIDAELHGA